MEPSHNTEEAFKDQKTVLRVLGALQIGYGLVLLVSWGINLSKLLDSNGPQNPLPIQTSIQALPMLFVWALSDIVIGFGSCLCRRWARTIIISISWFTIIGFFLSAPWLYLGIRTYCASCTSTEINPDAFKFIAAIIHGIGSLISALVSVIFIFIYSRNSVRLTCEKYDLKIRWIDACPIPVLVAVIFFAYSGLTLLSSALFGNPVFEFFGRFITGTSAIILCATQGLLYLTICIGIYRLKLPILTLATFISTFLGISLFVTLSQISMADYSHLMRRAMFEMYTRHLNSVEDFFLRLYILACELILIAFLVFLRRFFRAVRPEKSVHRLTTQPRVS